MTGSRRTEEDTRLHPKEREREGEKERERQRVRVRERERIRERVRERERVRGIVSENRETQRERERVRGIVSENRETETERESQREKEWVRERVCVCVSEKESSTLFRYSSPTGSCNIQDTAVVPRE